MVIASPSGSESLARTSVEPSGTVRVPSSFTLYVSFTALGLRLKLTVVVKFERLSLMFASFSALRIRPVSV